MTHPVRWLLLVLAVAGASPLLAGGQPDLSFLLSDVSGPAKKPDDGPAGPAKPTKCQLKGKIDGNEARLTATFEFVTEQPGAVLPLALGQAQPTDAKLDDKTPLFRAEPKGFAVTVEKPGTHTLVVQMVVPVTSRGDERALELDLPGAPITTLELELPGEVKDAPRLADPLANALVRWEGGALAGTLGTAAKLDVRWRVPRSKAAPAVTEAEGRITVLLTTERELVTRAELTLTAENAPVDVWRLVVPAGAAVSFPPASEARLAGPPKREEGKALAEVTVRLKDKGDAPLAVVVTVRTPRIEKAKAGAVLPVGPFAVAGATRQAGHILVTNQVAEVRLQMQPRGDTAPRDLTDEERRRDPPPVAAFRYAGAAVPERPLAATAAGTASLLDLEVESVRGLFETSATHALRLARDEAGDRFWRVRTTLEVRPLRAGVDHLDVRLPAGCDYDEKVGPLPAALVRRAEFDAATRLLRFHLAADATARGSFDLSFEADYPPPGDATRQTLPLPSPANTRDRGAQVTLAVPEDTELLAPEGANPAFELATQEPQRQVWRADRLPDAVTAAWRASRPVARVMSEADLTLTPRDGRVRHRLSYAFPRARPAQVALRVPEAVAGRLRVLDGGTLVEDGRAVRLPGGTDKTAVLELEYSFAPGEDGKAFFAGPALAVPLVQPDEPAEGATRVRVWAEPGVVPHLPAGEWTDEPLEVVKGNPRLPALVAKVARLDRDLTLRLGDADAPAGPPVLVDRVLVRATVQDGGAQQTYRARFLVTRLGGRAPEVELPAPVPGLDLTILLDGKEIAFETVGEDGRRADGGRVARLRLSPEVVRGPAVLEVSYQVRAVRPGGVLQTVLQPPALRGAVGGVPTRWDVRLPAGWLVLGPEGGPGSERVWEWRGWLAGTRPAATHADLERWFAAGPNAPPPAADEAAGAHPSFTAWRNAPEPLTVTHVPEQSWLLGCSLVLVLVGGGLFLAARRTGGGPAAAWVWPVLALLVAAAVAARLFWPAALAAVAQGCQPGAAVLALVVGAQLLIQEHRRRQIVFLPSFSRGGSSVTRAAAAAQTGEPSTVDHQRAGSAGSWAGEGPRPDGGSSKQPSRAGREPAQ